MDNVNNNEETNQPTPFASMQLSDPKVVKMLRRAVDPDVTWWWVATWRGDKQGVTHCDVVAGPHFPRGLAGEGFHHIMNTFEDSWLKFVFNAFREAFGDEAERELYRFVNSRRELREVAEDVIISMTAKDVMAVAKPKKEDVSFHDLKSHDLKPAEQLPPPPPDEPPDLLRPHLN